MAKFSRDDREMFYSQAAGLHDYAGELDAKADDLYLRGANTLAALNRALASQTRALALEFRKAGDSVE